MGGLVLSLFPGIGLLDMAFEEEGFTVVRGPDRLWGGDIHSFTAPAGRFDGVIGGPPCQAHSRYAGINRAIGNKIAPDLVPEFGRIVGEAKPSWWLMENVPLVQDLEVEGFVTRRALLDNRWLGEDQSRKRAFQFGTASGSRLKIEVATFDSPVWEPTCLASEGKAGRITNTKQNGQQKSVYNPRRDWPNFLALQGLPADFLDDAPFTTTAKYKVVGNGVPLPMGRAIARAVLEAINLASPTQDRAA